MIFFYPASTQVQRKIPKETIYNRIRPSGAVKQIFVQQLDSIVWQNKLAASTLNINEHSDVPEIQVFRLHLRTAKLDERVLVSLDKYIPSPIVFELSYQGQLQQAMCYKRTSLAENSKQVLSGYFYSNHASAEAEGDALPFASDTKQLYHTLLRNLLPVAARPQESLEQQLERIEQINSLQKQIRTLQSKINKEKQFNRQVHMHQSQQKLQQQLNELTVN